MRNWVGERGERVVVKKGPRMGSAIPPGDALTERPNQGAATSASQISNSYHVREARERGSISVPLFIII